MFQAGLNGSSLISLSQAVFMHMRFEMWLSELDIFSSVKQFIMQKYITNPKITSLLLKKKRARFTAFPILEVLDAPYCSFFPKKCKKREHKFSITANAWECSPYVLTPFKKQVNKPSLLQLD